MEKLRVILSGGGTGGHIYPAISVADELTRRLGDGLEILFVGAEGKMEMEKVPSCGYRIEGLTVAGIQRRLTLSNLKLPVKILRSLSRAKKIITEFRPDVVAGFGGYASGPVLWSAQRMGIPTVLQEQNSYAGLTNKILAKRARAICVAYNGMEKFFPEESIVHTGNPIRISRDELPARDQALEFFGLSGDKPVVLIVGGSLGTRTLNDMMMRNLDILLSERKIQVIWQTGKYYESETERFIEGKDMTGIWKNAFIDRMDMAYSAADLIVSRAGASSVSELCVVGKPVIFVPSPNVAEDHQTKNAMALASRDAAVVVPDSVAVEKVLPLAAELISDKGRTQRLSANISAMAKEDAARTIADIILRTAGK